MRYTDGNYGSTTHEGGMMSDLSNEQELIKMSLTSFVKNAFYESQDAFTERFRETVSKVSDKFALQLAQWSRNNGLRTINQMVLIEKLSSDDFHNAFQNLVRRPDELLDIVGYYAMINGQHLEDLTLANKLKKAIKEKLESFNEYQLGKYKGKGNSKINLYDLVNLTHPKSEAIDKLYNDTLETPETWETKISGSGNTKENWEELLDNKKLFNLAFIRNLRNMLQAGVDEERLAEYASELSMKNVFPYQIIQALGIAIESGLTEGGKLFTILEDKIKESLEKFTEFLPGKSVVCIDTSGSMTWGASGSQRLLDIAMYYGMYLAEMTDSEVYLYSDTYEKISNDISMKQALVEAEANGGGTYLKGLLDKIKDKYDSYFIITDEQNADRSAMKVDGDAMLWNISSYQGSISKINGWTYVSGLDDRLLSLSKNLNNIDELEKEILAIEL